MLEGLEGMRVDPQSREQWTRNLLTLIERRAGATRGGAETVEDRLEVLRLHRLIEDEHEKFFGPQVRDALRAGASWQQVQTATGWDETGDISLDWGRARFGGSSPEELAEVNEHLERSRRERAEMYQAWQDGRERQAEA